MHTSQPYETAPAGAAPGPGPGRSHDRSRLIRRGVAAAVLAYGLALALGSHAGFPASRLTHSVMPYLADKPLGEDGFYMLTVAWHLAQGHGVTYNDGLVVTGIQPLATATDAALGGIVRLCGGGRWAFARCVLLFQVLLLLALAALTGALAARIAPASVSRDDAATAAFCIAALSFPLFRLTTYGLETGLYLALIATCVLFTLNRPPASWRTRDAVTFGVLAGLAGLGRIDFGVVFALYLGLTVLRRSLSPGRAVASGVCALTVVAPWFLWIHHVSGRWLPSSGPAEFAAVTMTSLWPRLQTAVAALAQSLAPMLYLNGVHLVLGRLWRGGTAQWVFDGACLVLIAATLRLLRPSATGPAASPALPVLKDWTVALAGLVVVYPLVSWATHFYHRYDAPLFVIVIPLLAVRLAAWWPGWRRSLSLAGGLALLFTAFAVPSLHAGRIGNTQVLSAGFVKGTLPATARVGAFQSGVIGYFDGNVVNLDGKMNRDALAAIETGTLPAYLDRSDIGYLVDRPSVIDGTLPADYLRARWQPCPQQVPGGFSVCLVRR